MQVREKNDRVKWIKTCDRFFLGRKESRLKEGWRVRASTWLKVRKGNDKIKEMKPFTEDLFLTGQSGSIE